MVMIFPVLTVLAVDDDELQLRLWKRELEGAACRLLTQHDPVAACRLARSEDFAAAVVDTHMSTMSGPEVVKRLLAIQPVLPILAVSHDDTAPAIVDMMRSGVRDYLVKPVSGPDLMRAVESILPAQADGGTLGITRREAQVLDLLGDGYRNTDIASQLQLSYKTIDGVLIRLRAKLGCADSAALRRFAVEHKRHKTNEGRPAHELILLGHPQVDAQHQIIADLACRLEHALDHGETVSAMALFDELESFARRHDATESELLRTAGMPAPEVAAHQGEHAAFLEQLVRSRSLVGDDQALAILRTCVHAWLHVHTQHHDRALVAYLSCNSVSRA